MCLLLDRSLAEDMQYSVRAICAKKDCEIENSILWRQNIRGDALFRRPDIGFSLL
jgi:hypothetical protein